MSGTNTVILSTADCCRRPTGLHDRTRDSDEEDIRDRDYDVAALANNLSQAFRYGLYSNDDIEDVRLVMSLQCFLSSSSSAMCVRESAPLFFHFFNLQSFLSFLTRWSVHPPTSVVKVRRGLTGYGAGFSTLAY